MFSRRMVFVLVTLGVIVIALTGLVATAQGQQLGGNPYFVSASSSCDKGSFTFYNPGILDSGKAVAVNGKYNTYVEAWDSEGTFLGSRGFNVFSGDTSYSGMIEYLAQPVDTVTFRLIQSGILASPSLDNGGGGIVVDSVTVLAGCVVAPGCDVLIPLDEAVVGTFVASAQLYGQPGEPIDVVVEAGKSYHVLGQDATESYYKILIGCAFTWVEKSTVGPTYDEPWNGTPLPTIIVN